MAVDGLPKGAISRALEATKKALLDPAKAVAHEAALGLRRTRLDAELVGLGWDSRNTKRRTEIKAELKKIDGELAQFTKERMDRIRNFR